MQVVVTESQLLQMGCSSRIYLDSCQFVHTQIQEPQIRILQCYGLDAVVGYTYHIQRFILAQVKARQLVVRERQRIEIREIAYRETAQRIAR